MIVRARRQLGYTLVVLLGLLGVAAASALFVWAAPRDSTTARDRRTAAALSIARDALIGRAAGDDTRPGSLPCPDVDNDGAADGVAGNCTAFLGRLPWRTLGLPDVRDGAGERLWYALTSAYRDNPAGGPLNSDTPGAFTVRDSVANVVASGAPALVIAPGPVVGAQSRGMASQSVAAMYLDGENGNGDASYVVAPASSSFNDRLMIISREDLFRPVAARVAKEVQAALESYRTAHAYYPAANPYSSGGPAYACDPATYVGRIPYTISTTSPPSGCVAQAPWNAELPTWFFDNNWHLLTHYAVAPACTASDAASQATCAATGGTNAPSITGVSTSVRVVVLVSGPARGTQVRPCASPADCLDDAANTDGNLAYARPSQWPASNDRLAATCATAGPCAAMP